MLLNDKSIEATCAAGRANSPVATDVIELEDKSRSTRRVNCVIPFGTFVRRLPFNRIVTTFGEKTVAIFSLMAAMPVSLRPEAVQLMPISVVLSLTTKQEQGPMAAGGGQRHVSSEKEENGAPLAHVPLTTDCKVAFDRSQSSDPH